MAYERTENFLFLVLFERIVRSRLFIATISYHFIEISVKFRQSYHRNITRKDIKMYFFDFLVFRI